MFDWQDTEPTTGLSYHQYAWLLRGEGLTLQRVAERLGTTDIAVKRACKRYPLESVENSVKPEFPDKVNIDITWREALDGAEFVKELKKRFENHQDEANADVKCDLPIIIYTSDWHLGSLATNHEHLKAWLEMVLGTDGVYLVCVGLDIESRGHFRSILPTLQQVYSTEEQQVIFGQIWEELTNKGKLLASCWDNHSIEQYEKLIGASFYKSMQAKKIPYFRGMGLLHLRVGGNLEQTYDHLVTHNTRFGSSYNLTHGLKQTARMHGFTGDIVAAGHIHNPSVETVGNRAFIRTGTFKTDDEYSQRYWGQGKYACPCVVFHAGRHEFVPFWTVDQALAYRRGMLSDGAVQKANAA